MGQAARDLGEQPRRSKVGTAIHMLRWTRDWSLRDMEERTGISAATIGRYENGDTTPTVDRLESIARTFEMSLGDLLTEAERYSQTGLLVYAA